jgi:hypothetical protein
MGNITNMKKKSSDIEWLIRNYMDDLKKFGANEKNIREYYLEWKETHPNGSIGDYLWMVFNSIINEIPIQVHDEVERYRMNHEVYKSMYFYLVKHENRSGKHVWKLATENYIKQQYYSCSFEQDIEIISGHCCPHCDSLNGKLIPLEDAVKHPDILELDKCTRPNCNCSYAAIGRRNEDGRLIFK